MKTTALAEIFAGRRWLVMGILNVTPDSFHDGGRFGSLYAAVEQAEAMARAGAAIIDVGGESTRPGAEPVSLDDELGRVIPVIEAIVERTGTPLSVDTSKAEVARRALAAGAAMINDVTALRGDPEMAAVAAEAGCAVCLMHMLGEPRTMQANPVYKDVVTDIGGFFRERLESAAAAGIRRENILLDPGIGFGKTLEHNLAILRRLGEFAALGRPLLVGISRKRFIGMVTGEDDTQARLPGTISANVVALMNGAAVFRVHDVAENFQALKVAAAVMDAD
ncbi:MAG: dihydropteroate synthase [Thermoleophilia bacterium]